MLEVFKWLVFGGVLLVVLPYAFIAAWGLVVGLWRQLPARDASGGQAAGGSEPPKTA